MGKILICDDNEHWWDVCRSACKTLNQYCKIVRTNSEVLREAATSGYDVIMIDLQNLVQRGGQFRGHAYDYIERLRTLQSGTTLIGVSNLEEDFFEEEVKQNLDDVVDKGKLIFQLDGTYSGWENLLRKHLVIKS